MKPKFVLVALIAGALLLETGCVQPIGAVRTSPALAYRQVHDNAVRDGQPSAETRVVLRRFDQDNCFLQTPDAALEVLHRKAVDSRERGMIFALAELNYVTGEKLRHSVKAWETRDPRDYYLASALYAWFFLFGEAAEPPPSPFDIRFRSACDLYNYSLGWAISERRGTNAVAVLADGIRRLPIGQIEIKFSPTDFPWSTQEFARFVLADHFLVRGLTLRNGQSGLGAPLAAITRPIANTTLSRAVPATALLRPNGKLEDIAGGRIQASLELYSTSDDVSVEINGRAIPLETDTTLPMAYILNQSAMWSLGRLQFLSGEERIPSDIYLTQPYRPGRVPIIFVHGTFSSPVWWAEMFNTLAADPELRKRCQFWHFVYNSGNPMVYSAVKLREALTAKIKELDPAGRDPALQQAVVIGHSQGGLLTKLTATDAGEKLLQKVLRKKRIEDAGLTAEQQQLLRHYTCFEPLPCVKRVVFVSTPHRGSYLAGNFARNLARRMISFPKKMLDRTRQLAGLAEKLDLPPELKGTPTSLDSMSPRNPFLLALAELPVASGIQCNSIIAVQGNGDYHQGKDGLVTYDSAHVDYAESEFIVRSFHSCQGKPSVIEEVRRILHKHVASLPKS